jgi:pentapeptide MXKDX repeat protein
MKKLLVATAALTLMCSSAFAQNTTGPAAQGDNMNKPGMNTMDKDSMDKGSMKKGTTTGMDNKMSKDGMNNDMSKDNMKKGDMKK